MRWEWMILIIVTVITSISCVTTEQEQIYTDSSEVSDDLLRTAREGKVADVRALSEKAGIPTALSTENPE